MRAFMTVCAALQIVGGVIAWVQHVNFHPINNILAAVTILFLLPSAYRGLP